MKDSCEIIRDLMPLYCDKVCSKDSAEAVEKHIRNCTECNKIYQEMKMPDEISEVMQKQAFEEQEISSMKKVKKKWNKKKKWAALIGVGAGVALVFIFRQTIILFGAFGLLGLESAAAKIEVYQDINQYQGYIHYGTYQEAGYGSVLDEKYSQFIHGGKDMSIFPYMITEDMDVREFQVVYYNPWDAQFVSYLTVAYDDADYAGEMQRLEEKGIKTYTGKFDLAGRKTGHYSVTGEPEGYEIAALDVDSYGYVYAIVPEDENNTVTYVEITFCNYFLDLDIHEYLPDEYLLEGFDATEDNPFRKMKLGE